jgi:hypothetical protein
VLCVPDAAGAFQNGLMNIFSASLKPIDQTAFMRAIKRRFRVCRYACRYECPCILVRCSTRQQRSGIPPLVYCSHNETRNSTSSAVTVSKRQGRNDSVSSSHVSWAIYLWSWKYKLQSFCPLM